MKLSSLLFAAFATVAAAAPTNLEVTDVEKRQLGGGGYCFVFARGSTEPPPLASDYH